MRTTSRINAEYAAMPETVAIIGIDETREMRPAATGHKPSYYRKFFERQLCGAWQSLACIPGERLRTANSGHWDRCDRPGGATHYSGCVSNTRSVGRLHDALN